MGMIFKSIEGDKKDVATGTLENFRRGIRGKVLDPKSPSYSDARTIWNATIDRRPALIVQCEEGGDVLRCVQFARDNGLLVAVRGGGHHIAGNATCDEGLVIDLSRLRSVRVEAQTSRAFVEPGATLADVDAATTPYGLAVPVGINSTTGIAGLTLGGGFGWITRKYGLTIDSLVSADVVTAEGKMLHASATENTDLFWALRGGGGNFGIVTSFEFKLREVGQQVLSGLVVHPLDGAEALLKQYSALLEDAPDELTCWAVLRDAPPLPFLPTEWHGRKVLIFAMCYVGDLAEGERATAAIRALGSPIADVVGPNPFDGWQTAFDPLLTPGARNYWKTRDFAELPDGAISAVVGAARAAPGPECEIFIFHIGGAASRVPVSSTAFPQRSAHFGMNVHSRWRDQSADKQYVEWARRAFDATAPFASGTAYVNFMPGDEGERVQSAYGENYARLTEIKRRYDPKNLFRLNQNIVP
jgi:FAD/FMN-containing dehydrogenase